MSEENTIEVNERHYKNLNFAVALAQERIAELDKKVEEYTRYLIDNHMLASFNAWGADQAGVGELSKPHDEGMAQGGDAYTDVMYGDSPDY